jgi:hypothetical protein
VANATAVVVVRNIQPLMQAVFNAAKTGAIKLQPSGGTQTLGRSAGQQRNGFRLATRGQAANPG